MLGESKRPAMFGARREHGGAIATIRDIVEIAAIVAAGVWAFYIFIYENRIKPEYETPVLSISGRLEPLGIVNGLQAVRFHITIKNEGKVKIRALGQAFTLMGTTVRPAKTPFRSETPTNDLYRRDMIRGKSLVLFRSAEVMRLGNPGTTADLSIEPGATIEDDSIEYVRAHAYNRLDLFLKFIYTTHDQATIPTTLRIDADGMPQFDYDARKISNAYDFKVASTALF